MSDHLVSHVRLHHHGHTGMATWWPPVAPCGYRPRRHLTFTEVETQSWSKILVLYIGSCQTKSLTP